MTTDNSGYFCCAPGTIGYGASLTGSDGCADPGYAPEGAILLSVISAGPSKVNFRTLSKKVSQARD